MYDIVVECVLVTSGDYPLLHSRYRLGPLLGAGSNGVTYRGWDGDGRPVAVKIVHPLVGGRALAELQGLARAVAAVGHPGLLVVEEVLEVGQGAALVSSLVAGGSLAPPSRQGDDGGREGCPATRDGERSWGLHLSRMSAVCLALSALHGAGLVHGDLKPPNVLLHLSGEPVLTDTGLAIWQADVGQWLPALVADRGYADPEVLAGLPVGPAADVRAAGLLCWEGLAGGRPLGSPRSSAGRGGRWPGRARVPSVGDVVPGLPVGLLDLVAASVLAKASERPSALELAAGLEGWATRVPGTTTKAGSRPSSSPTALPSPRRRPDAEEPGGHAGPRSRPAPPAAAPPWSRAERVLLLAAVAAGVVALLAVLAGVAGLLSPGAVRPSPTQVSAHRSRSNEMARNDSLGGRLALMADATPPSEERIQWLSTRDASERLGVTLRTLYRFIDEGQIPAYQFGRVIRLQAGDVSRFIEASRIPPGTLRHLYPEPKADPSG